MIGSCVVVEPIASETRVERATGTLWRRVLDGVLVLPPGSDELLHITAPGDVVWHLLAEAVTVGDLAEALADFYEVPVPVVRSDIEPVLTALVASGAIRISNRSW